MNIVFITITNHYKLAYWTLVYGSLSFKYVCKFILPRLEGLWVTLVDVVLLNRKATVTWSVPETPIICLQILTRVELSFLGAHLHIILYLCLRTDNSVVSFANASSRWLCWTLLLPNLCPWRRANLRSCKL